MYVHTTRILCTNMYLFISLSIYIHTDIYTLVGNTMTYIPWSVAGMPSHPSRTCHIQTYMYLSAYLVHIHTYIHTYIHKVIASKHTLPPITPMSCTYMHVSIYLSIYAHTHTHTHTLVGSKHALPPIAAAPLQKFSKVSSSVLLICQSDSQKNF